MDIVSLSKMVLAGCHQGILDGFKQGLQSGGPVFKYIADYGYCAVGINRGGSSTYSDCLRIDEWIFNKFMSFRTKTA